MSLWVRTARVVSGVGLGAVAALHGVWAAGSSWPARDRRALGEAVVGNSEAFPGPRATATVAGVAATGALVTAGALGNGRGVVRVRRLAGLALLTRAAVGGDVALAALGMPAAKERFLRLDNRFYRPLCAVLGAAVLIGARRRPRTAHPEGTAL